LKEEKLVGYIGYAFLFVGIFLGLYVFVEAARVFSGSSSPPMIFTPPPGASPETSYLPNALAWFFMLIAMLGVACMVSIEGLKLIRERLGIKSKK